MKKASLLVIAGVVTAALVVVAMRYRHADPQIRTRKVAFDNTYNGATTLRVHVKVDDGSEQAATATCDAKTCTFSLALADGVHEVMLAIEQNGIRGAFGRFTLDSAPSR